MAFRKRDAVTRRETALKQLSEAEARLGELVAARNAALLGDHDEDAGKLRLEIDRQANAVKDIADKVELLAVEVEREANERRVKEHQGLIKRLEQKFAARDEAAAALQETIAQAIKQLRQVCDINTAIRAAWPFTTSDLLACHLGDPGVMQQLQFEIFRVGHKPKLYGGLDKGPHYPDFPGGKAPRLELAGRPDLVKPFAAALHDGSATASKIMRTGKNTSPEDLPPVDISMLKPEPLVNGGTVETDTRTPAEQRLAALYLRQAELAEKSITDPNADREYGEIVAEIAIAQSEIGVSNVP